MILPYCQVLIVYSGLPLSHGGGGDASRERADEENRENRTDSNSVFLQTRVWQRKYDKITQYSQETGNAIRAKQPW